MMPVARRWSRNPRSLWVVAGIYLLVAVVQIAQAAFDHPRLPVVHWVLGGFWLMLAIGSAVYADRLRRARPSQCATSTSRET